MAMASLDSDALKRIAQAPLQAIVFDFDGTLVHSNLIKKQGLIDVSQAAIEAHNTTPLNAIWLAETLIRLWEGLYHCYLGQSVDRYELFAHAAKTLADLGCWPHAQAEAIGAQMAQEYTHYCETRIPDAPPLSGALDLLNTLQAHGLPCFINSATPKTTLETLIARRGWQGYFSGIYGRPQSKEANLSAILQTHGLSAASVLVIGDGQDDLKSAQTLGTLFLGIRGTGNNYQHPANVPCIGEFSGLQHALMGALAHV